MNRIYLWLAIALVAGFLAIRIAQWNLRPFHTDEAVQAFQTWKLLKGEGYKYDPADKHGPSLYYGTFAVAKVLGWDEARLNEQQFRSISLAAALLLLVVLLKWRDRIGKGAALLAAGLLAMAPLSVLYSTYFIQEAWFCLFSWLLLNACLSFAESPRMRHAMAVGVWAGAMQVTKETSVLHFSAIACGVGLAGLGQWRLRITSFRQYLPGAAVALASAFVIYALFFTSFFSNASGLLDGVTTYMHYARRAEGAGHAAPWHAYLSLFWPHVREGVHWGEPILALCALLGLALLFQKRNPPSPFIRAAAAFTIVLLALYSAIPYKTPWLLLTPYVGICLLAGYGLATAWRLRQDRLTRSGVALLAVAAFAELHTREHLALHRYAGDARVPYFYQQTAPQFPALLLRLETEKEQHPDKNPAVAVCSPDYAWPLPWYLRNWKRVGYFTETPALISYDIVLADSRLTDQNFARVLHGQPAEPHGLRPNVLLWLAAHRHSPTPSQP